MLLIYLKVIEAPRPRIKAGPLEFDEKHGIFFVRVTSLTARRIYPHVIVQAMRIADVGPLPAFMRSFESHWRHKEYHEDRDMTLFSMIGCGSFGDAGPFWLAKYDGRPILFSYDVGTIKIGLVDYEQLDRPLTLEADLLIFAEDVHGKKSRMIRKTVTFRPDPSKARYDLLRQSAKES